MSVWSRWPKWRSLCQAWDLKIGSGITSAQETYVSPSVRAVSKRAIPPGSRQPPASSRFSPLDMLGSARFPKNIHPPSRLEKYLIRRMPPNQSNDKAPGMGEHPSRNVDQPETNRFHTAIYPASPQYQALHS